MAIRHYIDNEVPWGSGTGEWSSRTQSGSSSITRTSAAGWCDRGAFGLRLTTSDAPAYVSKSLNLDLAGGDNCYVGLWLRLIQAGSAEVQLLELVGAGGVSLAGICLTETRLRLFVVRDDGGQVDVVSASGVIQAARWHYLVLHLRRAAAFNSSDGLARLFLDGMPLLTTPLVDNYDLASAPAALDLGAKLAYPAGYVLDLDEVKLADAYPEPFVPACRDELLCPGRLVVLYRQDSSDSLAFADYCVAQAALPRASLIPIPAGADETLTSYAAFQAQVEEPINSYFARNPSVADNCCCFLLGYGVPGSFTSGGTLHSAVARLMRLGQPFQADGVGNPVCNPADVQRLSVAQLRVQGLYLASRVDAASLAQAKAIVDQALAISALPSLPASDLLLTNHNSYRQSLACQRLRIQTGGLAPNPQLSHDAAIWGQIESASFASPAGTRAVSCSTAAGSAQSLRGAGICRSSLLAGYAAAAGFVAAAEELSAQPFFEMLRIGGSLAEAFAVACSRLDGGATLAGWPLMSLPFRRGGYNLYRGCGGIEQVDWQTPVAMLRPEQTQVVLPLEGQAETVVTYVARAVSGRGVEEHNTHVACAVVTDDSGQVSPLLPKPTNLSASRQSDGSIRVSFTLPACAGLNWPGEVEIFSDAGAGTVNFDQPVASVALNDRPRAAYGVTLPGTAGALLLAARCRLNAAVGQASHVALAAALPAPAPVIL